MSGIGARELWGTLRNNSQVKLEKEDDMIPPDVKVNDESTILYVNYALLFFCKNLVKNIEAKIGEILRICLECTQGWDLVNVDRK